MSIAASDVVPVGAGIHYLHEDNPDAIGRALAAWLSRM